MQFEDIRPIVSGLAGGMIAYGLYGLWSKSLPKQFNGKSASALKSQYRVAIWASNAAMAFGILWALALYQWWGYARNDWRPLGLGFGFALTAPLLLLPLTAVFIGGRPAEAYAAYALSQRTPAKYLYSLLLLGVPVLISTLMFW